MRRDTVILGIFLLVVGSSIGYYLAYRKFIALVKDSMHQVRVEPAAGAPDVKVRVLAKQFSWHFHYPGPDGEFGAADTVRISAANPTGIDWSDPRSVDDFVTGELVLPCGIVATLSVTSSDVVHAIGITELGLAKDAIPGREATAFLETPVEPRSGTLRCVQLCGAGFEDHHAPYRFLPASDFDAWQSSQAPSAPANRSGGDQ